MTNQISHNDFCTVDSWIERSCPILYLDPLEYHEVNYDQVRDGSDTFFPVGSQTLYELDVHHIVNNYAPWILDQYVGTFYIQDFKDMIFNTFKGRYGELMNLQGTYSFIFSSLGRGILEPFYIVNTMVEYITLAHRDPHSDLHLAYIPSVSELPEPVFCKILLSIICSLRTSLRYDMNVLKFNMEKGKLNSFTMNELIALFPLNDSVHVALGKVYNAILDCIVGFNLKVPFTIKAEHSPDSYENRNLFTRYHIFTGRS